MKKLISTLITITLIFLLNIAFADVIDSGNYNGTDWTVEDNGTLTFDGPLSTTSLQNGSIYWPSISSYKNKITTIIFSEKVEFVPRNAFMNWPYVTTIYFNSDKIHILENAFNGCNNLSTIYACIDFNVGTNAFKGCSSLRKLYFPGIQKKWEAEKSQFAQGNDYLSSTDLDVICQNLNTHTPHINQAQQFFRASIDIWIDTSWIDTNDYEIFEIINNSETLPDGQVEKYYDESSPYDFAFFIYNVPVGIHNYRVYAVTAQQTIP